MRLTQLTQLTQKSRPLLTEVWLMTPTAIHHTLSDRGVNLDMHRETLLMDAAQGILSDDLH